MYGVAQLCIVIVSTHIFVDKVVVSYSYNELHSMIAFGVGFRLQTREKEMQYIPITLWSEATILLKLIAKMKLKNRQIRQDTLVAGR